MFWLQRKSLLHGHVAKIDPRMPTFCMSDGRFHLYEAPGTSEQKELERLVEREREAEAKRKAIAVPFINNYCDLFRCIAIMQTKEAPVSQTSFRSKHFASITVDVTGWHEHEWNVKFKRFCALPHHDYYETVALSTMTITRLKETAEFLLVSGSFPGPHGPVIPEMHREAVRIPGRKMWWNDSRVTSPDCVSLSFNWSAIDLEWTAKTSNQNVFLSCFSNITIAPLVTTTR